ncbi:MAG: type II CAAX endopeptidase family protein [Balneolaceae bacterium]|nr:type II CAAX endopeptidase family protein [Balneolaceae bacterium]
MNILVNHDEDRIRAGWRLLIQLFLFITISLLVILSFELLPFEPPQYLRQSSIFIGGVASVWLTAVFVDKRRFLSLGIRPDAVNWKDFAAGNLIAATSMGIIFVVEWSAGWIEITGFGWQRSLQWPFVVISLGYLMSMTLVGFNEELVFRGYQIKNLTEGLRGRHFTVQQAILISIMVSSVLFGLAHMGNPNATAVSTVNIMGAGIVLALPYVVTGRLGLSVGIHLSWNFFQGGVFGFPVSGMPFRASVIQIDQLGPRILTGAQFGPEAGLMGIIGLLLVVGGCYWYSRMSGLTIRIDESFKDR